MNDNLKVAPKNNVKEGKPRPTLLPMDVLMEMMCPAYEEGVEKYERESWRDGFYVSTLMDAAFRHMIEFYYNGHDIDEASSTKKHHLAGALFSIASVLHALKTRPELDDRFSKKELPPMNQKTGQFYFTIPKHGWEGTWSSGKSEDLDQKLSFLKSRTELALPPERKKAKRQLNWTLKRNGLNLDDLSESDEPKKRSFKVRNSREHLILGNLIDFPCKWSKDGGNGKSTVYVWLTNLQYQRINRIFKVQRNQFRKHANDALDDLLTSFLSVCRQDNGK